MELDHVELDELRIRPSGNRPTDNLPVVGLEAWRFIGPARYGALRSITVWHGPRGLGGRK